MNESRLIAIGQIGIQRPLIWHCCAGCVRKVILFNDVSTFYGYLKQNLVNTYAF